MGIVVQNDLKPYTPCSASSSRRMSVIELVERNFKNMDMESVLVLYKKYILHACLVSIFEQVQRKSTKLLKSVSKLSYQQMLEKLWLHWKRGEKEETW